MSGERKPCGVRRASRTIFFTANDIAWPLTEFTGATMQKDKSFDEVVKILIAHFDPKPVVKAECFHFHRHDETAAETVAVYVA